LKDERYLETATETIDQIIESQPIMVTFEHVVKREADFYNGEDINELFWIKGLLENEEKQLNKDNFKVLHDDLWHMFLPSLREVFSLMKSQLDLARTGGDKRLNVKKVVLIGGFAESKTLRGYLQEKLKKINTKLNSKVELIAPSIR